MNLNTAVAALMFTVSVPLAYAQNLASFAVKASTDPLTASADGVVEAVRQTMISAQVSGAIVELNVKPGDSVKAGQVLARIDARAAEQTAAAGRAQVQAARASLEVSSKDLNRQRQLFQRGFISQAALDQAEAVFRSAEAQVNAQIAQSGAANTQTDFHVLRAPYAGIVAEVPVVQGDMAMPGRALMTIYDPSELRVTATLPQSAGNAGAAAAFRIELPGASGERITPVRMTLLPTADPNTHTLQVRLDLPAGLKSAVPGVFARVWLPRGDVIAAPDALRVSVPSAAIVRRAEVTGVYVLDGGGKPSLRQVRLGRSANGMVEVLAGLASGEKVATDPQAAARVR